MVTTHRLLTYEDYASLPEDGPRYELIGGELFEMPSPSRVHQLIVVRLRLVVLLHTFVMTRRLGEVYVAPFDIRLSLTMWFSQTFCMSAMNALAATVQISSWAVPISRWRCFLPPLVCAT